MSYITDILDDVRRQIAPTSQALNEARDRRDAVLAAARQFPGARSGFNSGSVAHGTANTVKDADCGVVLDRRHYRDLGPDSAAQTGPCAVVEAVRAHLRGSALREQYPDVGFEVQDRSVLVRFRQPVSDGRGGLIDPTVDLIVALQRRDQPGLWIPNNMRRGRPSWDASHPAEHTRLFLPDDRALRRTRVWTVRLAKAWNARHTDWRFASFNLAALAYWGLNQPVNTGAAFVAFFEHAAASLAQRRTADPAGVSECIKLPAEKDKAVRRLEKARALAWQAYDASSEDAARDALAKLFPDQVTPSPATAWSNALVQGSRGGAGVGLSADGLLTAGGAASTLKPVRAFGAPTTPTAPTRAGAPRDARSGRGGA